MSAPTPLERARALVGRLHTAVAAGDLAAESTELERLRGRLLALRGDAPDGDRRLLISEEQLAELHLSEDSEAVLEAFGRALAIALHGAKTRGDFDACAELLGDFEALHSVRLDSPSVRAWRAKGLVEALHVARGVGNLAQRDAWLDELRRLTANAGEAPVREEMAWGLANTLYQLAGEPGAASRRALLLRELEELSAAHPGQVMLGAIALVGRIAVRPDERSALLERLGRLAAEHPDEAMLVALARQHGA
ncbi:MAG: hypothetical protein AAGC60_03175 [Acidobacteriota bacterium]